MENKATSTAKKAVETVTAVLKGKEKKTLKQLFTDGLNDAYSAEQQLVEALPLLANAAENEELSEAFEKHLAQTKKHVWRLEKVFEKMGIEKSKKKCEAMEGLVKEAQEIINKYEENAVRDSALIIAAQKVEHYEIATYGSLCELADVLGMRKVWEILNRTLAEEDETDQLLSEIAQDINDEAYETSDEEDEDNEDSGESK